MTLHDPVQVAEDLWHGTGNKDDDALPSYTETDADGAVLVYHGTGHLDLEATAELASQDGPDEKDEETAGFLVVPPLDLMPGTLLVAVGPGASASRRTSTPRRSTSWSASTPCARRSAAISLSSSRS
ncbi:hypothetical protein ACFU8Q_04210 [Streptomyces sp. NPDC057543]|uniref:hypothetical protein n=1 Tax=Streptomyces sp. NPDC057543 TaxID=3346163 RepID=UPI0036C5ED4E